MKTLKKTKEEINNESEKKTGSFSQRFLSKKLHVFIVSAIIIAILSIGGYFYYNYSTKHIRTEKENDLQGITTLKNNQLVQWREQRIADAKMITDSRFFANGIEEWLNNRNIKQLNTDILEQLQSAITNYGYEDIFLVSVQGELFLSLEPNLKEIDDVTKAKITNITNKNDLTFTDLYFCPGHNTIHYDIIAPVKNNESTVIAYLVFRINPYKFLYPFIQIWPLPSESAEMLLVRKDGDSVLFLNELRHQKNTELQLRIPLTRKDLPATQAILGRTGIFDGNDYRGIEVIACLAHVPNTDWFLVSKVDKSEIFAEINFRGIIVSIIIILLILSLTIGITWIYHFRQKNIFKNLWQTQEEYRTILYSIGDAVITTDISGRITNMNKVAESLTGWKEAKAIGKKLVNVFNIINEETRATAEDPVSKVLKNGHIVELANHTVLISKNGTEYQIADSAAPIKNEKGETKGVVLVFSNVTDKYAAQKQLKESEERFNLAMQASNDGLFDWNLETNEIYYSPGWKRMLGYEDHELPNDFSVWENTTDKEDVRKSWELQQKLISKEIDRFVMEFKMKHKDGHFVDILSRAEAFFNEKGKAIRMIGTHTDISDRKQAEEKYRKLVENMNSGVAIYQPINDEKDFKLIDFNKAAEKITNTKKSNVVGSTLLTEFPNMDKSPLFKALQEVSKSGKNKYLPPFYYKDDQREGWRENFIYKLPTNEIVAIFNDVTERKDAEIKLQNQNTELNKAKEKAEESEAKLVAAFESMSEAIFISDSKGNLINANESYIHLTGFGTKDEYIRNFENYTFLFDVYLPTGEIAPIEKWAVPRALNGETCENEIYKIHKKDTNDTWIGSYNFAPIRNRDEEIVGCVVTIRDVTENIRKENELIKAKEKAEESDRLKSAFLANMSHEIRTPMNGILGFANLLKDPRLNDEEKKEYIKIIDKAGARMLNIINDIVSISQIEAGQTKLDIRESNINEQLEYIYTFFKPEVEAKGIQLFFKNSLPSNKAFIKTDREKVFAVLTNLVKNAIKYTNQGAIEFGYEKKDDNLEFFIKDSGVGIPQDRQEAIFERFVQADIEDKMARQGAGLGLSISRAYVEMLGGKLWVESEVGKGSIFYFTIPYDETSKNESDSEDIDKSEISTNKDLKILIAEDDETSGQLLSIILDKYGKEIIHVQSGTEVVDACRSNSDINLILMDIQMPDLNGYEATQQIRQFNKEVVIIAQTAYGLAGDREKAMEAGCNDYISKPIQKDKLKSLIQKYIKYLQNNY